MARSWTATSGKIGEPGPLTAAVEGDEESELGAGKEQLGVDRILFDGPHVTLEAFADGRTPGRAEVIGAVDVGRHVAVAMTVEGDEGGALVVGAGEDRGDPGAFGDIGHRVGDSGPCGPRVARDLHQPVVGSDPDQVRIDGRLGDGVDGGVVLGGRVVDGDAAGCLLPLSRGVIGGEIGRDGPPRVAAIGGVVEILRSVVEGVSLRSGSGGSACSS